MTVTTIVHAAVFLALSIGVQRQSVVRGRIFDSKTGGPLLLAVRLDATNEHTKTNFDGFFQINSKVGSDSLSESTMQIVYAGYVKKLVKLPTSWKSP